MSTRTRRIAVVMLVAVVVFAVILTATPSGITVNAAPGPVLTVNNTGDTVTPGGCSTPSSQCTIRDAFNIAGANPGSTVNIPPGDYSLDRSCSVCSSLVVGGNTIVNGTGATIHGNGKTSVLSASGFAKLTGITFTGGEADAVNEGGGIVISYSNGGNVTLTNCVIAGNHSPYQGGGIGANGNVTLVNTVVRDNTVTSTNGGGGGGIVLLGYTLTLLNSSVTGNTSGTDGGGIYAYPNSAIIMTNSTISGNRSGINGGGIFFDQSFQTLTGTNSTISGNSATGYGGGIYSQGSVLLTNATLAGNVSTNIVSANGGTITLNNSLLSSTGASANCFGTGIVSHDYNLSSDGTCAFLQLHDLVNTDPHLAPLASNGGPTQTHALLAGSPAIDKIPVTGAACPSMDQRGIRRPVGAGCDIGAYEFNTPAPLPAPRPSPPRTPGNPLPAPLPAQRPTGPPPGPGAPPPAPLPRPR